jgi:SAM-dependent methyltransferase
VSALAGSFGEDPEAYDRSRPSYPPELADDLAGTGDIDVLDVGCGTGKLGCLLAQRGCRVLGVELDERMADVARRHGLDIEVAPFESWDDRGRRFDLVTAAQAWHWIAPDIGPARAAEILRPGGRLVVIWNLIVHEPTMRAALDEAYDREVPEMASSALRSRALGMENAGERLAGVDETGAFGPQSSRKDTWQRTYTTVEWVDQLATHSDHRALPAERRTALLHAVGAAIDANGGHLTVDYTTLSIFATRR